MVYTKEDILLESKFQSDKSAIYCTGEMIFDNIMESMETIDDVDMFMEGGSEALKSLSSQIKAIFTRILEFVKVQVRKVQEYRQHAKFKKMMTPEMKNTIKRIKGGEKIPCPDIRKVAELSKKYQSKASSYISYVADNMERIKSGSKSEREINSLIDRMEDEGDDVLDELEDLQDEIEDTLSEKHDMTVDDVYKMIQYGFDTIDSIETFVTGEVRSNSTVIEGIVDGFLTMDADDFKEYVESCGDYYTIEEDTICYEAGKIKAGLGKIRSGLSNVVHKIDRFVTKHAKVISKILAVISVICGVLTTVNTVKNVKPTIEDAKKGKKYRSQYEDYARGLIDEAKEKIYNNEKERAENQLNRNKERAEEHKHINDVQRQNKESDPKATNQLHHKVKQKYDKEDEHNNWLYDNTTGFAYKDIERAKEEIDREDSIYKNKKNKAIKATAKSAAAGALTGVTALGSAALRHKK